MTLILDSRYKMSYTDTHVFFLTGPFSQWNESPFRAALPAIDGLCAASPDMDFNCGEQFMMAGKAWLFGDTQTLEKIMAVTPTSGFSNAIPKAQKKLGREVQGFRPEIWSTHDTAIVRAGNMAKFAQNPRHLKALAWTKNRVLVEGADYDPIWGVGLAWNNPSIANPANWKGLNKLGYVLMDVRAAQC